MKNILLKLEYDGSAFHGWQEQPNQRTVQGELEDALSFVMGKDIHVDGTSRTDAGVHALGQCCTFSGDFGIPVENIKKAVNNVLSQGRTGVGTKPGDIRIIDCKEMPEGFHARFDSKGKTYRYLISTSEPDLFRRNYCYFIDRNSSKENEFSSDFGLDIDAMEKAWEAICLPTPYLRDLCFIQLL